MKLKDTGELIVGQDSFGQVQYEIDVPERDHRREGRGVLLADPHVLFTALRAGEAKLILASGDEIRIVLTNHVGQEKEASFVTIGPVP